MALYLALLWFLCRLPSSILVLRPWCRLLMLGYPLRRLLPLMLGGGASLLRLGSSRLMYFSASLLRRRRAWGWRSALRE